mgnify:CR=1 FL=1
MFEDLQPAIVWQHFATLCAFPRPSKAEGPLRELLVVGVLCNDAGLAEQDGVWGITGDPTEAALLVAARKAGLDEHALRQAAPRLDEIAFDSARQYMASLNRLDGQSFLHSAEHLQIAGRAAARAPQSAECPGSRRTASAPIDSRSTSGAFSKSRMP